MADRTVTHDVRLVREVLFSNDVLAVALACARPGSAPLELEPRPWHSLVLPLTGIFARHDGARRQVVALPGLAMFLPAATSHRLSFPHGIGDRSLAIRFSPDYWERMAPLLARVFATLTLGPDLLLQKALLWKCLREDRWDDLQVEECATALLLGMADKVRNEETRPAMTARQERAVEAIKEAIAAEPGKRWTLRTLGDVANLSACHLARLFRSATGMPLHRYLTLVRLDRALDPVADGCDLARLGLEVGFASHSHFTATFRSFFGMTPTEWRRRTRKGDTICRTTQLWKS